MTRRSLRWAISALAAVVLAVLPLAAVQTTPASAATLTPSNIAAYRSTAIDPATGRVFVAGDDRISVFNPDGTLLTTIHDIWGAGGMDLDGSHLWVTETTAGSVAKIDLATLTVAQTYVLGVPISDNLAVVNGGIWFGVQDGSFGSVHRYDLGVGTITQIGGSYNTPAVVRIPGSSTQLLAYSRTSSFGEVTRLNTTAPYWIGPTMSLGTTVNHLAVSSDGTKFWYAGQASFEEVAIAAWAKTGVAYPLGSTSAAYSPAFGGVLAGGDNARIRIARVGSPSPTHVLTVPGQPASRSVLLAPNGLRAYAMVSGSLYTESLAPSGTAAPSTIIADSSATISITGSGLGATSAVTIGGLTATVLETTSSLVRVTAPDGVPMGPQPIVLASPFGYLTLSVTVQPNVGATLQGTTRSPTAAVTGVELTLTGGGLASPRTVTSGISGMYEIAGLPFGTDYVLVAHDPSGALLDQTVSSITLVPNTAATVNLTLQAPPSPTTATLSRFRVDGEVRDLQIDPATGRIYVSAGDEIAVFDASGVLLRRILNQPGAAGLAIDGGSLYVNSVSSARITRVALATATVTGSWSTTTVSNGALAFAGGRVWFGVAPSGWSQVAGLDPATGVISVANGSVYSPGLRSVTGDPNLLLAWDRGYSGLSVYVYDTTLAPVRTTASRSNVGGPVAASAAGNRLWAINGKQHSLSTLAPDGVVYPSTSGWGSVSYSAARGGVLGLGQSVSQVGIPRATHAIADTPRASELNPTADRYAYATITGDVVVLDLVPYVTGTSTSPLYAQATPLTLPLTGTGLGAVSAATFDGAPVPFSAGGTNAIQLSLPSLSAGAHTITVTTPWGTSAPFSITATVRPPVPSITALAPSTVPTAGGTITITGTGLTGATSVKFGSANATSFSVVDDEHITATAPVHAVGTASITVTTPGGQNSTSPTFGWVAPTPVITSLSSTTGPPGGGTAITINGSGFQYATAVSFGTTPVASYTVVNDTKITTTVPAHASGPVHVQVTTAGGTSVPVAADVYTYGVPAPTVTSLSPNRGPAAGGFNVVVRGTRFTGATRVAFGGTASTFVVIDDGTIVATAPAHAPGIFNVNVSAPSGTSADAFSAWFQYDAPVSGSLTGIVRSSAGPVAGMMVIVSPAASPAILASTTSAADGSYFFNLPAGTYKVITLDPAVFSGASEYFISQWYDNGGSSLDQFGVATTVTVAGNASTTLQPIVLKHNAPATITGVVKDGTTPLAGMVVVVLPIDQPTLSAWGVTAANGTFRITNLAPGSYRIATIDPASLFGSPSFYLPQIYDNQGATEEDLTHATPVAVAPKQTLALRTISLVHN